MVWGQMGGGGVCDVAYTGCSAWHVCSRRLSGKPSAVSIRWMPTPPPPPPPPPPPSPQPQIMNKTIAITTLFHRQHHSNHHHHYHYLLLIQGEIVKLGADESGVVNISAKASHLCPPPPPIPPLPMHPHTPPPHHPLNFSCSHQAGSPICAPRCMKPYSLFI